MGASDLSALCQRLETLCEQGAAPEALAAQLARLEAENRRSQGRLERVASGLRPRPPLAAEPPRPATRHAQHSAASHRSDSKAA